MLRENGYELDEVETTPHAPAVQHFERARPNQLWQSDLFTFLLKRENRRVYLVVFLDDHSRFVVGYGVWASASGALVREVLEAAIANFGAPEEVLTDNGPQYVTWRGTSAFARLLERRGIRHMVARPRRPQTLGKTERFWGTLWRECVESAVFRASTTRGGASGTSSTTTTSSGRIKGSRGWCRRTATLRRRRRCARRCGARGRECAGAGGAGGAAQELLSDGAGRATEISLHSEGSRVVLTRSDGAREEVDLEATGRRETDTEVPPMPEPVAITVVAPEAVNPRGGEEPEAGGAS